MADKGLELPPDSKSILDEYIGEEYTFVVSWIFDIEKFKNESATVDIHGRTPTINTVEFL